MKKGARISHHDLDSQRFCTHTHNVEHLGVAARIHEEAVRAGLGLTSSKGHRFSGGGRFVKKRRVG